MTPTEEIKSRIAILSDDIAFLKAKLSEMEVGSVTISYGSHVDYPLGKIPADSASDIDITTALCDHLNKTKAFNLVGGIKVWVNDNPATARIFYVTETRELIVSPF